jgi:hypothetical protein
MGSYQSISGDPCFTPPKTAPVTGSADVIDDATKAEIVNLQIRAVQNRLYIQESFTSSQTAAPRIALKRSAFLLNSGTEVDQDSQIFTDTP